MKTRTKILVFCLSLFCGLISTNIVDATKTTQDLLNVHVIAHTHDDVGWLKTVDQYYYGANQTIQQAGVQYIIDSVVEALQKGSHRKFIYVEVAFFERWWNEQTDATKQIVRGLVANGQLEFINGGYCMNDEASTHYSAVIDQMTQGHLFLYNEFGVKPRIGWHIDPFGHAATQASLFAQMGFDGFFFGRIEYDDHDIRNQTQNMEFVWRGSQSLGADTQIWSHLLYTDYCYLHGFSFEWGADPIQDDPRLFDVNVKQRCDDFANQVRARAASVRTNNVLIPFGCDFQFQDPNVNFKNMDKIIRYINANPDVYGMNVFYSTPSIYLDAVHAADLTWSVKTLDFFPYADFEHAYWTGYFTSRPALKGYVRSMNNLLHASDKILTTASAILDIDSGDAYQYLDEINSLSQAFSIAQHHDAVAGTEKQHVANDYAKRLSIGQDNAQEMISDIFAKLSGGAVYSIVLLTELDDQLKFSFCPLMNISQCPATNPLTYGKTVAIVAYNPIAWSSSYQYLRIPVPTPNVKVVDSDGKDVVFQTMPNEDYSDFTTLVFEVKLPPMGFATYFIQPVQADDSVHAQSEIMEFSSEGVLPSDLDADIVLDNDYLTVTISKDTGRISNIVSKVINLDTQVTQDFLWWKSFTVQEFKTNDDQRSGAYIFRPNGTDPFDFGVANPVVKVVSGKLVQEVYQVWNNWITQVIRLYNGQNHIELESTVGPIDVSDGFGKEIISRFESDIDSNGYLWTDSQGQEMIERLLNARPDRNFTGTEPIAGNYYPMNTAAYIKDGERQLTFLTERSRGCASLGDGEFESMLHRRTLWDDARGVDEPINETDVIRTIQYVTFTSPSESARQQRSLSLFLNNPPILAFATTASPNEYITQHTTKFAPLKKALPAPLHLLNFKTLSDGRVLIRLHHIYGAGEDAQYSSAVSVDLNTLFNNLIVTDLTEMALTANQPKSELHRLNWKTSSSHNEAPAFEEVAMAPGSTIVTLRPMEIRTFLARLTPINV